MEECKVISGFENYEVSNQGYVRNKKTGLILKTQLTNGYHCVYLRNLDKKQKLKIHRLVALHFIQQLSGKTHVNHVDGNKENNTQYNLEWVTPKENSKHAIINGLQGSRTKVSKETKNKAISEYKNTNISQVKLSDKYGVTLRTIERWISSDKKIKKLS